MKRGSARRRTQTPGRGARLNLPFTCTTSDVLAAGWTAALAGSSWLGSTANCATHIPGGNYVYTVTFSAPGTAANDTLSGSLMVDHALAMTLNGNPVAISLPAAPWDVVTPFSANGLVSGTNTLVFTVGNGPGGTSGGASGLDFVATVAPTPPKQPDCATVSGNLLSSGNCGFELPSIGATNIQTYTPTSPPAGFVWTVAGTGMEIDGNGRLQSNSGLQSIDLNPNGPGGEVYQDIPTTAGDLYSLSFAMSGNPGCTSPVVKTVAVTLGGSTQSFSFDTTGNTKQAPT